MYPFPITYAHGMSSINDGLADKLGYNKIEQALERQSSFVRRITATRIAAVLEGVAEEYSLVTDAARKAALSRTYHNHRFAFRFNPSDSYGVRR
jgi:hypothetical protein